MTAQAMIPVAATLKASEDVCQTLARHVEVMPRKCHIWRIYNILHFRRILRLLKNWHVCFLLQS